VARIPKGQSWPTQGFFRKSLLPLARNDHLAQQGGTAGRRTNHTALNQAVTDKSVSREKYSILGRENEETVFGPGCVLAVFVAQKLSAK